MKSKPEAKIIDSAEDSAYERYLYRCLAPMPFRKYRKRREYLEAAIPKGFHKKLLVLNGKVVGQIEYAPAEISGYPVKGDNITVMHCIWVLRKAKGHNLGKQLLTSMMKSEGKAVGFSTIALENHWSPWLRKEQMEKLGFRSLDSVEVAHKTKHRGQKFRIHLMWLSTTKNANPPTWDESKLLRGVDFCLAHPLYRSERTKLEKILERCEG